MALQRPPPPRPSAHAIILRTNNGSSRRWLRMIPPWAPMLRYSAIFYDIVRCSSGSALGEGLSQNAGLWNELVSGEASVVIAAVVTSPKSIMSACRDVFLMEPTRSGAKRLFITSEMLEVQFDQL